MNEKEQALQEIKKIAAENNITRKEVFGIFGEEALAVNISKTPDQALHSKLNLSNVLYYIGGFVIIAGIITFLAINWNLLNSAARVLASLGAAVVLYISAALFHKNKKTAALAQALFFISQIILPIGMIIALNEMQITIGSGWQSLIALICFCVALASYYGFKTIIFVVFEVLFGSWLYFAATTYFVGDIAAGLAHFWEYRILVLGTSFLLLSEYFKGTKRVAMTPAMRTLGLIMFLGPAMSLGGWSPNANLFWEVIFPFLVFAVIFLSTYFKSTAFLAIGSLFLMAYIFKTTAEYFSTGFGWPLTLVISGILIIAVGQLFVYVNKKYIRQNSNA